MNRTVKIIIIVVGGLILASGLFASGFVAGRLSSAVRGFNKSANQDNRQTFPGQGRMFNRNRLAFPWQNQPDDQWNHPNKDTNPFNEPPSIPRSDRLNQNNPGTTNPDNPGSSDQQNRDNSFSGGGMANGGTAGTNSQATASPTLQVTPRASGPISLTNAQAAVQSYLTGLKNSNLAIEEIIIFDNNAYARIIEKDTGFGAFGLMVDPAKLQVSAEPGPDMKWNLKYSAGVTGGSGTASAKITSPDKMTITPAAALKAAQEYLTKNLPGYSLDQKTSSFYGYYTVNYLKDGKFEGMLGVNGLTEEVLPYTWHGVYVEMNIIPK